MYVVPLERDLIIQTEDIKEENPDFNQGSIINDDLFSSDDDIKLDNSENRTFSSTIKSLQSHSFEPGHDQQTALQTYDTVNICNKMLTKLQEKYGLSCSSKTSQVKIKILKFNQPVGDIFEFIRKATNIDLLKKPVFLIDDEK